MKKELVTGAALSASFMSLPSFAVDFSSIFDAIDLSTVATSVIAVGVTAVGIAVALKAITLAKRAVGKA
ncbi:phage coat protein [Vibrio agarivorans]|uniref:phage coat protein n=1 Tax=Vibrio agarivorans TaxID=153622 RepID=UPI002230A8E9|nr:phage coat protein [Vibrio agarivorans]